MKNGFAEHELFVPLEHRPEASALTVRDLIGRVEKGRVRLPDFQRPLRWSGEDVRRLLDSVARGYPIGSLLFWKRDAPAAKVRVGNAFISGPALSDSWWVVDGQQRTTALAACLLDLNQGGDPKFRPYFDVETQQFVNGPCPQDKVGIWVPVAMLGDLRRLGKWNRNHFVGDEEQWQRIEEMQQQLLDYSVPIYIVETHDERALRGIFARMNSTGVRMRADEVFQALLRRKDADSQSLDITQLQEWCGKETFGAPARNDVLKALLAMSGVDFNNRLEDIPQKELASKVRQDDAQVAFFSTIEFFKEECGIPNFQLLPYPVVFTAVAKWFYVFPNTSDDIRKHLAKWIWQCAVAGAYQQGHTLRLRDHLKIIDPRHSEEVAIHTLRRETRTVEVHSWSLETFDFHNAKTRMELLALWELKPRRPEGEVSFAALIDSGRFTSEIYSRQRGRTLGEETLLLAQTIANRVLLDESKKNLETLIRAWDPVADEHVLRSHLIDERMFQAMLDENIETFLQSRAEALSNYMVRFLVQKSGLDLPYLAPMESYLDPAGWMEEP